jgi:hypothetical protein
MSPILELERNTVPRPTRLGHIRGGVTKQTAKGVDYPAATNTIVFTSHEEIWLDRLARDYGGEVHEYMPQGQTERAYRLITEADAVFGLLAFEDRESNLVQYLELYVRSGLARRCDGETCTKVDVVDDEVVAEEVPCICAATGKQECQPASRIGLILPQTGWGVWQLHTPSITAAAALRDNLIMLQGTVGPLNGLPVRLTYFPRKFRRGTTNRVWGVELAADVRAVLDAKASGNPLRAMVDLALPAAARERLALSSGSVSSSSGEEGPQPNGPEEPQGRVDDAGTTPAEQPAPEAPPSDPWARYQAALNALAEHLGLDPAGVRLTRIGPWLKARKNPKLTTPVSKKWPAEELLALAEHLEAEMAAASQESMRV